MKIFTANIEFDTETKLYNGIISEVTNTNTQTSSLSEARNNLEKLLKLSFNDYVMLPIFDIKSNNEINSKFNNVKLFIEIIDKTLIKNVYPEETSTIAKYPFKVHSMRELVSYRVSELSKASIFCYEKKYFLASLINIRSLLETICLLFYLFEKIFNSIEENNAKKYYDDIDRILLGSKIKIENYEIKNPDPVNVITCIDHINKRFTGIKEKYDQLSEYYHPNFYGTLMFYGKIDEKKSLLKLIKNNNKYINSLCLNSLCDILKIFICYYDGIAYLLPAYSNLCETELKNK